MIEDIFTKLPERIAANDTAIAIHGDALDVLKSIKPGVINLIFADPPYNIGKDFGNGHESLSDDQYLEWCYEWIDECSRVLHRQGTFYLMAATQYMPHLDVFAKERFHVLSRIIWSYDSSGVQPKRKFGSNYEPILMLIKDFNNYTFNREAILVEAKTGAERNLIDYRKTPPQPYSKKKTPGNVWDFPRVRYRMPEYENHPTQKPEALLERIILASSNPGDLVFDPFGGSFTTGAVAVRLERRAISCDVNEDYFKIGIRRMGIAEEYQGEKLTRDLSRKTRNKAKKDHIVSDENQPRLPGY
jgi:adenine-specific DNA-methyltransferase